MVFERQHALLREAMAEAMRRASKVWSLGARDDIIQEGSGEEGSGEKGSGEECVVCLSSFTQGDELRELACGHVFHRDCIDQWLLPGAQEDRRTRSDLEGDDCMS